MMSRVSRFLSLLLLAPLVLVLTAWTPHASSVEITWAVYDDPTHDTVAKKQVQLFEQTHPGITVNLVTVPYSAYYTRLGSQIATGTSWDVFMINGAYFAQAAPQGALMNLTSQVKKQHINLKRYTTDPYNSTYHKQIYALPYELDMSGIYYNKSLFAAAHLKAPKWGWTWKDLLKDAKKLTKTRNGQKQWGFYSQNLYPAITSFVTENGGSILNKARTKATLETRQTTGALQFMVDLVRKYHVSPAPGELPANVDPFLSGRIAIVPNYSFSVMPTLQAPFKWAVAPWPKGKKYGAGYWTQAMAIYKRTPHPKESMIFLKFLLSATAQTAGALERGATPTLKSVASSKAYTQGPPNGIKIFVDEYKHGPAPVQFCKNWFPIMGSTTAALESELTKAYLGQESVKAAAKNADKAIDSLLNG